MSLKSYLLGQVLVWLIVRKTRQLSGEARIPASKSHSVRANFFGLLAEGISEAIIHDACADAYSMAKIVQELGAKVNIVGNKWVFEGTGGNLKVPYDVLNVGNSGTGLFITYAVSALLGSYVVVTGDEQLRYKPGRYGQPLLDALKDLGAKAAFSVRGDGKPPVVIRGVVRGGKTTIPGINSQWLTPLLIAMPLAEEDTEVYVPNLYERPYIEMTLQWVRRVGGRIDHENFEMFHIYGGQTYKPYRFTIPGDWESACFVLAAGVLVEDAEITIYGVDTRDVQGDKVVVDILKQMGADITVKNYGLDGITIRSTGELEGIEVDCKHLPDAIPYLAVLGTYAKGKTVLKNIESSRLKETDRPAVIKKELEKMGAKIELKKNEMIIHHSKLHGAWIDGHMDHRIIMATAIAGMIAEGVTVISDAEYYSKSFPTFYEVFKSLGANILKVKEVI